MDEELNAASRRARLITWRSIWLGLLMALAVAIVTPFNDYVVNNSFLVGSFFPPVVTLAMFAFVLLINGPLHKFVPRLALSPGELSIALAMGLIACSIPSQGLFRQFIPLPLAPFHFTDRADYHELFKGMDLPHWLWAVDNPETGSRERVFTAFYARLLPGEAIPWSHWVRPLAAWGSFAVMFLTALLSLACLFRYQWTVNERLPFPIAQLQSMLIAPPKPGRAFNDIFSSWVFWIAAFLVLTIQSSAVLNLYFPNTVTAIPFQYDLTKVFTDEPWVRLLPFLKANTIYFTLVGVSYFTATRVSFSLWGTAVGMGLFRWVLAMRNADLEPNAYVDQALGGSFVFVLGVLWIARHHLAVIWRALIGKRRPNDARAVFVPYRIAAIAFLIGTAGMFGWLVFVGVQLWLAASIVLMILMAHVITARVVAETGLAFLRVAVPFDSMIKALPPSLLTTKDAFFYGVSHYTYMQAGRESEMTFALHGLNVVDEAAERGVSRKGTVPVLMATLAITLIACAIASLWCYYSYASPMVDDNSGLINKWGLNEWPQAWMMEFPNYVKRGFYPDKNYSVWCQLLIGIGVMGFLQMMTWRFNAWPLLPVGYLLCNSWYITGVWFSLFLGWLAKVLILRFGGAKLFNDLKPFFVGLIFGEALAVGIWLIVTLVLALSGEDFHVVRFLPQ